MPDNDYRDDAATESLWESTLHVFNRARDGDRSAARILVERAVPQLRRWTHGRLPNYGRGPVDTEDVVQEAVLSTLKRLDRFQHRSVMALQAYLKQTVINSIRDVVRRARRRKVSDEPLDDMVAPGLSPLEQMIKRQSVARFVEALQRLKPTDRQAVICRIELGCSYDEVARRMGKTSAAAARMTVTRALQRLAAAMDIEKPPAS